MASFTVIAITFLSLFTTVYSHGMLCAPRQRGAYHSTKCGSNLPTPKNPITDYCAHCLNGGTVMTVANHLPRSGWSLYDPLSNQESTKRAGLCGDAFGNNAHMIGGRFMPYTETPIVSHWKTGSAVDFQVEIDTNHNGYFEFFLCNLDACQSKDISGECMKNGYCYRLIRVPHPDCQNPSRKTHFECGPIDEQFPSRWYVPCRKTGHVGVHLVGGARGTLRYLLPKGVSCSHCVLQWYWGTANSCAPRGFLNYFKTYNNPFGDTCESDGGGRGGYRPGMATCGGRLVPEEFWSCADVSISPSKGQNITLTGTDPSLLFGIDENQNTVQEENSENEESSGNAQNGFEKPIDKNMSETSVPSSESEPSEDVPLLPGLEEDPDMQTQQNITEPTYESPTPTPTEIQNKGPLASNGKLGDQHKCLKQNEACDGTIPCCGTQKVCVYTQQRGFVCKLWYTLWQEAMNRT